eukprot:757989-Hanusia_phi.AAC.1
MLPLLRSREARCSEHTAAVLTVSRGYDESEDHRLTILRPPRGPPDSTRELRTGLPDSEDHRHCFRRVPDHRIPGHGYPGRALRLSDPGRLGQCQRIGSPRRPIVTDTAARLRVPVRSPGVPRQLHGGR